ncbi:MAG TPA: FtsQ-type POTRA domain-containing protein, partial [Thermomicrobiales bacterium]|nr:FtsQ-type POTRA domain-containing protein [Thermomicrobiales bacterium]
MARAETGRRPRPAPAGEAKERRPAAAPPAKGRRPEGARRPPAPPVTRPGPPVARKSPPQAGKRGAARPARPARQPAPRRPGRLAAVAANGRLAALLLALALAAVLAYGLTADAFNVRRLDITGSALTGEPQVAAAAGVSGNNVFSVDPQAVAERLAALPTVREARVRAAL